MSRHFAGRAVRALTWCPATVSLQDPTSGTAVFSASPFDTNKQFYAITLFIPLARYSTFTAPTLYLPPSPWNQQPATTTTCLTATRKVRTVAGATRPCSFRVHHVQTATELSRPWQVMLPTLRSSSVAGTRHSSSLTTPLNCVMRSLPTCSQRH